MSKQRIPTATRMFDRRYGKVPGYRAAVRDEQLKFDFGNLIRAAREEAGMTQQQLAKRAGTSQTAVSRLEDADYTGYRLQTLLRILSALKQPLFGGHRQPETAGRRKAARANVVPQARAASRR